MKVGKRRQLYGAAAIAVEKKTTSSPRRSREAAANPRKSPERSHQACNQTSRSPPQDLLREIAVAMNRSRLNIQTTIPFRTTWREAIKAVEASLGNLDEEFLVFPPGPGSQRRQLRQEAQKSPPSDSPLERGVGLPIKSSIDLQSLPRQRPPTEETRQLLRNMARQIAREDFREPFLRLQANLTDSHIPTVRGAFSLQALDGDIGDATCEVEAQMIFDTGASYTTVAEELLPDNFRQYLRDPIHDPYRSSNGVLTPRSVIIAKGQEIPEQFWGEITASELKRPGPIHSPAPPIFLSRVLTPAEKNYYSTELEFSCMVWTVRKLRAWIEAAEAPPIFYTDHIALIYLATSLSTASPDRLNLRLVRGSQYLQQFHIRVYHRAGLTNKIADGLLRLPATDPTTDDNDLDALHTYFADIDADTMVFVTSTVEISDDFQTRLKAAYPDDPRWSMVIAEIQRIEETPADGTKLPYVIRDSLLYSVQQEDNDQWLYIPDVVATKVFEMVHDEQGHQGLDRCWTRIHGLVVYKGHSKLKRHIATCGQCRKNNIQRHLPYGTLNPILSPPIPFHTVTIDFVVGLPLTTTGFDAMTTITYKFTKRVTAEPGKST
ncbi:hypothetical protein N7481_012934 [Penicillium waksmanii]|uniref:uncharacterized protein n=1 Tax=Penicillium waksmanii TaxID=69791 RepID=UPI002547973C|nr:uncharacterized protein N7481_012934 [Penicillium waksmanii]KAJ5966220.1 hypothetical protein N7481_012934 [Penicillium waksmanii]